MILRILVAVLLAGLLAVPTIAEAGFEVGPFYAAPEDVEMYIFSSSDDAPERMAVGLCSGVLAKLTNDGKVVAEFISPCLLGGTTFEGEAQPAGLLGIQVINLMGVRAGIYYNNSNVTDDDSIVYGFGISLTALGKQMTGGGP